jgi:hypothetical protein
MPAAIFKAEIDFAGGASFDPSLVLDDPATPLDVAVLGTAAADTVDITEFVTQCYIRRALIDHQILLPAVLHALHLLMKQVNLIQPILVLLYMAKLNLCARFALRLSI